MSFFVDKSQGISLIVFKFNHNVCQCSIFFYAMSCFKIRHIAQLRGINVLHHVYPCQYFSFNSWNFIRYSDMQLGHIQLIRVLFFFQNSLLLVSIFFFFFFFVFCLLQLSLCFFHKMVLKYISLCTVWQSTYSTGNTLKIGLENNH